jgi:hypothetical protein
MATAFEFAGHHLSIVLARDGSRGVTIEELRGALLEGFKLDPETKLVLLLHCVNVEPPLACARCESASFHGVAGPQVDWTSNLTSLQINSGQTAAAVLPAGARFRVLVDHNVMACQPTRAQLALSPSAPGHWLDVAIYPKAIVSANGTDGSLAVTVRWRLQWLARTWHWSGSS